jgi:hypothetical protein
LGDKGLSVQSLAEQSNAAVAPIKFALACLERWRDVTWQPDESDQRLMPRALHKRAGRELRPGRGSARGIRNEWIVGATAMGQKAIEKWPGLLAEIEQRWQNRFGTEVMGGLRRALAAIVERQDSEAREP